jgi:hypothetical protein
MNIEVDITRNSWYHNFINLSLSLTGKIVIDPVYSIIFFKSRVGHVDLLESSEEFGRSCIQNTVVLADAMYGIIIIYM